MAARRPTSVRRGNGDIDVDDELQQLLKEQEDFMRQRQRPAAKITRVGAAATRPVAETKPEDEESKQEDEPLDEGPQVVGAVQERDVVALNESNRRVQPRATSGGFPAMRRRSESLFGRRQRKQVDAATATATSDASKLSGMGRIVERAPVVAPAATATAATVVDQTPSRSHRSDVVSDKEWEEIDQTNKAALASMSTADIRAAQQELFSMMDPELLAKLKGRSQTKKPVTTRVVESKSAAGSKREDVVAATKKLAAAGIDLSKIETEEQLFEEAKRLPVEERAKHEWMQPLPSDDVAANASAASASNPKATRSKLHPVRQNQSKKPGSTASAERFDFNGDMVGLNSSAPVHSGLYHHGDDPDAAGYTMDELLHLARSTIASQRAMALLTVSKILIKRQQQRQRGAPAVPAVLPAELPVALRMALDDQNYTALSAAIAALHAFLCEVEADNRNDAAQSVESSPRGTVVPTPTIRIHVDIDASNDDLLHQVVYLDTSESQEDGSKLGDQELSALDPIQGQLQMALISRLSYIVTSVQLPDADSLDKVLDVLIRLASHSPRSAQAVAADRKLMKALRTQYIENERVLTLQAEPAAEFSLAARFAVKTLGLIRVLCQGSRAVAALFVESGVIQSTKGFLALRASDEVEHAPLEAIQVESLRIWRVLLGYGLDYHCFSYLYPLLCGFDGVHLVRDNTSASSGVTRWSDRCLGAIFAALEAFARLDSVHEAQHYFNQFGFFIQLAKSELARRVGEPSADFVGVTAVRFLTTCAGLVSKFHLDRKPFISSFKLLASQLVAAPMREKLLNTAVGRELVVAVVAFSVQTLGHDLVDDDEVEDEVCHQFIVRTKPLLSAFVSSAADSMDPLQTCELLVATTDLLLRADHHDDEFIRSVYAAALKVVQDLQSGHQFWIHSLFTQVLFNPVVLQKTGIFPDLNDATVMGRVLVPIYQALVNSTKEQEEHSRLLFTSATNPKQNQTCHLVDPQDEHEYIGSNLPLPFFWMFCPFSRLEYTSVPPDSNKKLPRSATAIGPSHAEADEMKVIVSAACRYIGQLETVIGAVRGSCSDRTTLGDEDKLFHLMHVFFAGTDVLFDEYVDLALSKLLQKYALSVVTNSSPTALYDGILRSLRQFESIEAGETRETRETPTSFTTETETVMTFVERLVNEFTSSSFGNTHFARLITLFMLHDFPLAIRTWVWKELAESNLLHRLEPFNGTEARDATGMRATRDANRSDETLIRAMKTALATRQNGVLSHKRGPFAYWIAIHHTVAYIFGDEKSLVGDLSFARQKLLQELVLDASPVVWRHLLSYDTATFSPMPHAEVRQSRVNRVLQCAGFSETQAAAFRAVATTTIP